LSPTDPSRSPLNFVGGLVDRAMVRIPDFMLDENPLGRDEYMERLAFYADWDGSRPFFNTPATPPEAVVIESRPFGEGRRDLLRFASRFTPNNPAMRLDMTRDENNQSAYLHLWRHGDDTRRPLVLCVHGFGMAGPGRAERMFKIAKLFEQGMDVALYHLPHHWRRSASPPNNPFLRPQDVPFTIEEWVRNVHDLHSSVLLLRELGYARVGLIGASLGGLTAALYATTEPLVEFMFLVVPATNLESFLAPRASRMAFAPDGALATATRAALCRIAPASYRPRIDVDRIAVVAHEGDRICPEHYTRDLVARWDLEHYTRVVGGHWVYLDRKTRGRTWYGWLERHGFL